MVEGPNKVGEEMLIKNADMLRALVGRLVDITLVKGEKPVKCRIIEVNDLITSVKIVPNSTKD